MWIRNEKNTLRRSSAVWISFKYKMTRFLPAEGRLDYGDILRGFTAPVPKSMLVAGARGRFTHLCPSLCSLFRPDAGARSRLFLRRIHASYDRGRGTGSDRLGMFCVLLPGNLFSGLAKPLGTNGHKISAGSMHGEW